MIIVWVNLIAKAIEKVYDQILDEGAQSSYNRNHSNFVHWIDKNITPWPWSLTRGLWIIEFQSPTYKESLCERGIFINLVVDIRTEICIIISC